MVQLLRDRSGEVIVRLGNLLFRWRNVLFPLLYPALFIPSPRLFPTFAPAIVLGLAMAVTGQAIRAVTIGLEYIVRGGRYERVYAENLVTGGIFAHTRNPMYVGNVLILAGLGVMANSVWFVSIGVPVFVFFYYAIVRAEEAYLLARFGGEYERYMSEVPRFIPRLSGLTATLQSGELRGNRILRKEYGSTYAWMSGAVLLLMKNAAAVSSARFLAWRGALFGALGSLLVAYLVVRYLKKTHRLDVPA